MITRNCTHCETEIDVPVEGSITYPICGLDPDQPRFAHDFEDAPAFFLGGDPRRAPTPVEVPVS